MADASFWGKMLSDLRSERGLSQRQLARGAKVNRSTLRKVEDGISVASLEFMEKVLEFLGYELDVIEHATLMAMGKSRAITTADPTSRSRQAKACILSLSL